MAKEWLATGLNFRKASPTHVANISEDIVLGRWKENGDTIKFDKEGRLIDGQHRLLAIVKSGIASDVGVRCCVVGGLEPEVVRAVDGSRRERTMPQLLAYEREKNYVKLASSLKDITAHMQGALDHPGSGVTRAAQMEVLEDNPQIRELVQFACEIHGKCNGIVRPRSVALVCYEADSHGELDRGKRFWEEFVTSGPLDREGEPVCALYSKLLKNHTAKLRMSLLQVTAVVIVAFNKWIAGSRCISLRWRQYGDTREEFPKFEWPEDAD
jgi:hypothetical protein